MTIHPHISRECHYGNHGQGCDEQCLWADREGCLVICQCECHPRVGDRTRTPSVNPFHKEGYRPP